MNIGSYRFMEKIKLSQQTQRAKHTEHLVPESL